MQVTHARSRRAALFGLVLQVLVFGATYVLSQYAGSWAVRALTWYLAAGIPLWFISVLYFRQRELAELERLDLEQLRRERAAGTGSETIFDEEAGGFRVAQARLEWMTRWLVPFFSLAIGLILLGLGGSMLWGLWSLKLTLAGNTDTMLRWSEYPVRYVPITMIVLSIIMLCLFLYSRYASGMGRVEQWQMLRACGSYTLGNTLAIVAVLISLGVLLYANSQYLERLFAWVIPGLMIVLGVETLLNFVFDVYRPRTPGVEPRAAFDSRLLGLIGEPGGIAHSIAEAINYQFGFEVSQTWFYQLVQRAVLPLALTAAVVLWLLTAVVVVHPYERVVVERFGRQLNVEAPLQPGLHFKLPWPIDVAHQYDTGRIQQMYIGFADFDARPELDELSETGAVQWTDPTHFGQAHYDFLIPPPSADEVPSTQPTTPEDLVAGGDDDEAEERVPVNLVRMDVVFQYRIDPNNLAAYTQHSSRPDRLLRNVAWEEITRFVASRDIHTLLRLGELTEGGTSSLGHEIRERVARRIGPDGLNLGLEVVYVGLQNVHPERTVAEKFREVVTAEQEKIGQIRAALVTQNERLSRVAGDKERAIMLARAIDESRRLEVLLNNAERTLRQADEATVAAQRERLAALGPLLEERERTRWEAAKAREILEQRQEEFQWGLDYTMADLENARQAVAKAETAAAAAEQALEDELSRMRDELADVLEPRFVEALIDEAMAQAGLGFWREELVRWEADLEGEAAAVLAQGQARRWEIEMQAAAELARFELEREAYREAPYVYQLRLYLKVLTESLRQSRKVFLAFDPAGREVHIRYQAEEQPRPDILDVRANENP